MLTIHSFTFNPFHENTYLISNEDKKCAIIDPGCYDEEERNTIKNFIHNNGLTPTLLINTHCHIDHVWGNNFISKYYNLPLHMHKSEQIILDKLPEIAVMYGFKADAFTGDIIYVDESNTIKIDNDILSILYTPGHSPGSISLYNKKQQWVIGGDVLFKEGIGRTDLPGGNHQLLIASIQSKLWTLPNETVVYAGHGEPTTVGYEKAHNPFLT